jgi:NAD(P)-dependent dehydrogenase (short-subunit alcohol dehydrogenase family)
MATRRGTRGQLALVTGANKGVGRGIAQRLAALGMTVYVGARDAARGSRAAAELVASGADARFLQLDVTDERSIGSAADRIDAESGRLDVLVNNAGILTDPLVPPSATPLEHMRRTYETNVFGVIAITNAMLPLLRRSSGARIVNVSSDLGSLHHAASGDHPTGAFPPLLAYNSSKTALNAITLAYANELRGTGILVNAVSPGSVATDQNGHQGELTPEEGARIPVLMATLGDDGPTGTCRTEDGTPEGRTLPW